MSNRIEVHRLAVHLSRLMSLLWYFKVNKGILSLQVKHEVDWNKLAIEYVKRVKRA